ncbi:hypothetical protein DHEL01_v211968 [Diaporthe helianthi]|uniref:Serine/threonine-protein phosphatase 4 regulatory subunit 3-like central domain-containing protein n=1 Tax=Diaporthe helianthi TaxID=158607 RepID=A0A2P5HHA2_DIAHE|nr:hypothetical protein DHEL01_v211968 [Diaporthe helianthi]
MALSFQEAEGCAQIWKFVHDVQRTLKGDIVGPVDDSLSDDLAIDVTPSIQLPPADLSSLPDLESAIRVISSSATGRDTLAKLIMHEDYIGKLIPLVEMAEDLESLQDLHRLCNIMKTILLLNDTTIIEHAVSDECILGVVGALEYDPDFPQHKANHRQWLKDQSRYKEVVRIEDDQVRRRIHQTYRLQYMKDVVLARILDDPTFSVLNSMIFFNQVEIVQHLQSNGAFLRDLFSIFNPEEKAEQLRKKQAVLFIQQCCAIAKNLQIQNRQGFYSSLLNHGLLAVINFGLRNFDVSVRVGATDILVSMIDHDPHMIRHTLLRQILAKQLPLTDTLIDLLLVEVDLGVKSQISDALKVLLDTIPISQAPDAGIKVVNGELQSRPRPMNQINSLEGQQQTILEDFYGRSAARLFRPLLDLEGKTELKFSVHNDGIFSYLNDILCFFARQHHNLCKRFIRDHNIASRFAQLLSLAIRFFRHLVNHVADEFYVRLVAEKQVLGPILDVLLLTLPRDNLLSSACLDIFEYIRKENIKDLIKHLVENYREKITALGYLETFSDLVRQYEQARGFAGNMDTYFMESEDEMGRRPTHVNGRMMEQINVDPMEEEYWNTSDDEEENQTKLAARGSLVAGPSPGPGPLSALVDYHSDEESDENGGDVVMAQTDSDTSKGGKGGKSKEEPPTPKCADTVPPSLSSTPPERLSEKRRREEEDDDELGKLMQQNKRRNSTSAVRNASGAAATIPKKKSFNGAPSGTTGVKSINIRLGATVQNSVGQGPPGQDDGS